MRKFVLLFLILAACEQQKPALDRPPIPVVMEEVTIQDVPLYLHGVGHLVALKSVDIRSQVSGKLLALHARDGSDVQGDQPLYSIDPAPYDQRLAKAKANQEQHKSALKLAQQKQKRYKELLHKEFISQLKFEELTTDVEQARAALALDEAEVALAALDRSYCDIAAPLDGTIGATQFDPGNWISPGDCLATVRLVDPLIVRFSMPQKDFHKIQARSAPVEVFLPDDPVTTYPGEVYFVDNSFDNRSGTIVLKAHIPNHERNLWPGEFVQVRLQEKVVKDASLVPLGAIEVGQKGEFVYIVKEDNTVEKRPVTVIERFQGKAVIAHGLKAGEKVVVEGQLKLKSGARVQ